MGDALRVTVVATGLGQAAAAVRSKPEVFTQPVLVQAQATGTHDAVADAAVGRPARNAPCSAWYASASASQ